MVLGAQERKWAYPGGHNGKICVHKYTVSGRQSQHGSYARSIQFFTTSTFVFLLCGLTCNSLTICRMVRPAALSWRARSTLRLWRYCLQVCERVSRFARFAPGASAQNLV